MSKMVINTYGNNKEILRVADHYVSLPVTVSDEGIVAVNGKKIVPAGTIVGGKTKSVISNEQELVVKKNTQGALTGEAGAGVDAEGVLLNDVDVTYGANAGALVVHGYIKASKLPEPPVEDAIKALKQIVFTV